jgi:hypothetical protein
MAATLLRFGWIRPSPRRLTHSDGLQVTQVAIAWLRALARHDDAALRLTTVPEAIPDGLAAIAPGIIAELGLERTGVAYAADRFANLLYEAGLTPRSFDFCLRIPSPDGPAYLHEHQPVEIRLTVYPAPTGWLVSHLHDALEWHNRHAWTPPWAK